MNKMITVALIAGGLLLLDSPEAAAHKQVRSTYQPSAYYRVETRRARYMPNWLHRNHSFRRWYKHTPLRVKRHLAWHELFDIYRWERAYSKNHHRRGRHFDNHGYHRDHDRNDRRRRSHKHR